VRNYVIRRGGDSIVAAAVAGLFVEEAIAVYILAEMYNGKKILEPLLKLESCNLVPLTA
jgi:hypothetical protein